MANCSTLVKELKVKYQHKEFYVSEINKKPFNSKINVKRINNKWLSLLIHSMCRLSGILCLRTAK